MASNKTSKSKGAPTVAILMGSTSDWDVMQHAARNSSRTSAFPMRRVRFPRTARPPC